MRGGGGGEPETILHERGNHGLATVLRYCAGITKTYILKCFKLSGSLSVRRISLLERLPGRLRPCTRIRRVTFVISALLRIRRMPTPASPARRSRSDGRAARMCVR